MANEEEQRRHPRYELSERAAFLLGPATFVFSETVDISHGGTCLRQPNRFVIQAGEQLNLASDHIGATRAARVVNISPRGVHCAFDDDHPSLLDSETSAAL
jgi:hypothetical protein